MKTIVLATNNQGKVKELKALLEEMDIEILSLNDFSDVPEVIEDGETFFDNALKKARAVSDYTGYAVIADDSGLEVDALNGNPGVLSARYSGKGATDAKNICKLLKDLKNVPLKNRGASFKCVLVFYQSSGKYEKFEGELRGVIALEQKGTNGFGYDPVFYLPEHKKTVAQLDPEIKNRISHRANAFKKLKKSLQEIIK